ncbi:MAG: cell division topological specificity factor MinE [Helicobacteraceae bacterium]|jgi:cell division topological specificity factor MinE|nr:cell division topological specificity factor MinE [Helicobacteraceae bacterium]
MSLFGSLFKSGKSASIAKDRLLVTLTRERANAPSCFIDQMRDEIMSVIQRYAQVVDIRIVADKTHNIDRLEIKIDLENKQ